MVTNTGCVLYKSLSNKDKKLSIKNKALRQEARTPHSDLAFSFKITMLFTYQLSPWVLCGIFFTKLHPQPPGDDCSVLYISSQPRCGAKRRLRGRRYAALPAAVPAWCVLPGLADLPPSLIRFRCCSPVGAIRVAFVPVYAAAFSHVPSPGRFSDCINWLPCVFLILYYPDHLTRCWRHYCPQALLFYLSRDLRHPAGPYRML